MELQLVVNLKINIFQNSYNVKSCFYVNNHNFNLRRYSDVQLLWPEHMSAFTLYAFVLLVIFRIFILAFCYFQVKNLTSAFPTAPNPRAQHKINTWTGQRHVLSMATVALEVHHKFSSSHACRRGCTGLQTFGKKEEWKPVNRAVNSAQFKILAVVLWGRKCIHHKF